MASATEIKQVQLPDSTTKYDLIAKNGIFYIEGTGSTAGTWLGSHDDITEYYEGLTVAYKIPVAGASSSSTTTLNINGLGAVTVVKQVNTAISTTYPVNVIVLLVYTLDGTTAYWKTAEYDANTRNTVGDYRKNGTKLYFVGPTTSDASASSSYATSYTNSHCYAGTDNCLYSNDKKVLVVGEAELNQKAFSNITVGSTTIAADSTTDTLTLVAGTNVTITPDATNDKITIAATDTKYNNFVKSGSGAKAGLVPAPSTTAGTTKYLREDGTWVVPPDTKYTLPTASDTVLGGVKIGDNINVSSGTISVSAANTSTVGVAKLHKADDCISYTSDDGGVTPAAVKKAVSLFGNDLYVKKAGDTITGNILFSNTASTQSGQPNIKWKTIKENTPFMGFATDQSDGTFVLASLKGTNYTSGLAIGGGSGNLLWKGTKVATVSDIVTYSAITNAQIDSICGASISNLSEVNF